MLFVCEQLLMYDDKDLDYFKIAAMALYVWFLIYCQVEGKSSENKRGLTVCGNTSHQ